MLLTPFWKVINPAVNTVPYAFILLAHIAGINKKRGVDIDSLWDKLVAFLEVFDPRQVRYLGQELDHILKTVVSLAQHNKQVG